MKAQRHLAEVAAAAHREREEAVVAAAGRPWVGEEVAGEAEADPRRVAAAVVEAVPISAMPWVQYRLLIPEAPPCLSSAVTSHVVCRRHHGTGMNTARLMTSPSFALRKLKVFANHPRIRQALPYIRVFLPFAKQCHCFCRMGRFEACVVMRSENVVPVECQQSEKVTKRIMSAI